jgi:hypothetical protein
MPLLVRGTSSSRAPLHAGARFHPSRRSSTGKRPAALPAVLYSDGPSGHPRVFGRRCRRLPCSGVFLPGTRGLHQFQCNPSLRAAVITPLESAAAINQVLPQPMLPSPVLERLGFQVLFSRGLHDVRCLRPAASLPGLAAGFVRRSRAALTPLQRVSSASWLLAFTMSGFSLDGLHRLSSGHAEDVDEHENEHVHDALRQVRNHEPWAWP